MAEIVVNHPSSGATRHLLPDGEKYRCGSIVAPFLSPSGRGWTGEAGTGEGLHTQGARQEPHHG